MKEREDPRPKRLCSHCRGRKVCSCDQCIQSGGTCGYCQGYGHQVVVNPALPPEFAAEANPVKIPAAPRAAMRAARRKK